MCVVGCAVVWMFARPAFGSDGQAGWPAPTLAVCLAALTAIALWLSFVTRRLRAERRRLLSRCESMAAEQLHHQACDAHWESVVDASQDGVMTWDESENRVTYSAQWKSMLGYLEDEIGDSLDELFNRMDPVEASLLRTDLLYQMHHPHCKPFRGEVRVRAKDGGFRWMLCRAMADHDHAIQANEAQPDGPTSRVIAVFSDITHLKEAQEQLRNDAFHDKLTGLPNRALLRDRIKSSIRRSKRRKEYAFALLALDFKRFKVVNDSLGHEVGDLLLTQIAERLRQTLRETDTVSVEVGSMAARLGGDEFVILLDDLANRDDAHLIADRVQEKLSKPFDLNGHVVQSKASVGIVTNEGSYDHPDQILRDVNLAMERAKEGDGAERVVFDKAMHVDVLAQMNLESDLRKAVEDGSFHVVYQPILSLTSGKLAGFEALVRWDHPTRGRVRPDLFIGAAEELGLIVPIGRFVLETACEQLRRWQKRFPKQDRLEVNVNLSKRQLTQPDLVDMVRGIVNDSGIDPTTLKLEVTESAIMDQSQAFIPRMHELRELGVQLCMDDFGTGHSSLSSLHTFPIQVLKIDRSFIVNMGQQVEFSAVTQAIVTLSHTLKMSVVAEGIETAEQLAQLQALDCDYAQGYYFSRPLDAKAAEEYIRNQGLAKLSTAEAA